MQVTHIYNPLFTTIPQPIALESRRYLGNKSKLVKWIMQVIVDNTTDVHSFCDLFAGTGTVANQALNKYDKVIVNDTLFSNQVIYRAFWKDGEWDKNKLQDILDQYNALDEKTIADNYFSINFGGKFFEYNTAKKIGYIRQDIEDRKDTLTPKEYDILLATLIYNIDRVANTVGHFDAYIKTQCRVQPLILRLIDARQCANVEIYRNDANAFAKTLQSDLVYIDPPYNSRQYCRAYHVYETLVKWDEPKLYGVALKPAPENMSDYCTVKATEVFEDLITSLHTRYIVLSYNNMGLKGNARSNARISDDDIIRILSMRGEVKVFTQEHRPFSTGKSHITNNSERLFLCLCH